MVYTANWGIIWYLPLIKGTRKQLLNNETLAPFKGYQFYTATKGDLKPFRNHLARFGRYRPPGICESIHYFLKKTTYNGNGSKSWTTKTHDNYCQWSAFFATVKLGKCQLHLLFFSFPAWTKKTSKTSSSQSDCSTSWGLNFWKNLLQPRWEVQDIGCNWLYVGENNPRIWGHINNL